MNKHPAAEYEAFTDGLKKILKADPKLVKAAMEQEKNERAQERKTKKAGKSK
jgi:hypothetical protein